jgi:hypothetical protein
MGGSVLNALLDELKWRLTFHSHLCARFAKKSWPQKISPLRDHMMLSVDLQCMLPQKISMEQ